MPENESRSETERPSPGWTRTILDALSGGRRKSDGVASLTKTLTIIGVTVASCFTVVRMQLAASAEQSATQMAAYDRLVQRVVDQNDRNEERNRQTIAELAKSFQDLAATIRAAYYVKEGADPPRHGGRR